MVPFHAMDSEPGLEFQLLVSPKTLVVTLRQNHSALSIKRNLIQGMYFKLRSLRDEVTVFPKPYLYFPSIRNKGNDGHSCFNETQLQLKKSQTFAKI